MTIEPSLPKIPAVFPVAGPRSLPAALILFALVLLLLPGCGANRRLAKGKLSERTPEFLVARLLDNQVQADWLEARARLDYDDGYLAASATATIKMKRDSLLWMNVKKLGFELARVLITPDSVFVIDRINNEYIAEPLSYVEEAYRVPADLTMLQMLLLGNPVFFGSRRMEAELAAPSYHLYGRQSNTESDYWLAGQDLLLERMRFFDQTTGRRIEFQLGEYARLPDDQNFSYFRKLEVDSRETGKLSVEIKFNQVELNTPQDIRFSIPGRYTRAGQ